MNIKLILINLTFCLVFASPTLAAEYSPFLLQKRHDQVTFFNKTTDFFATVGKSDKAKARIKKQRRDARRRTRAAKAQNKKDAKAKKQAEKQEKIIMKKINAINEKY